MKIYFQSLKINFHVMKINFHVVKIVLQRVAEAFVRGTTYFCMRQKKGGERHQPFSSSVDSVNPEAGCFPDVTYFTFATTALKASG